MTTSPESKIAQAMAGLTVVELPDDLRIPLHSLQADTKHLLGRVAADGSVAGIMADSILERLSQIETAALILVNRQNAAPELFEALKLAETTLTRYIRTPPGEGMHEFSAEQMSQIVDAHPTIIAIRAALSKASPHIPAIKEEV